MRIRSASGLTALALAALLPAAPARGGAELTFDTPAAARFAFGGPLGERIERNIEGWLLPAPRANPGMLEMFRVRDRKPEPRLVPWAGEFAGKYLIALVQALRISERSDLGAHAESFVRQLISTQDRDGYLGPFPKRERLLGHWDLWGHYHVMQGLILWHEERGDPEALAAARRAADLICTTYLDAGRRAADAGSEEMNLAVIHVLGILHRKSGEGRYLRMMREIEKDWERAGDYFRKGLAGVDFYKTPRPRWESLHDLQGLVELYRITGDERYRTAFVNLWRSIARRDRHNTGGFSSGERAVGHPYSPAAIETCCTIAWMAITLDMLRLTGDPGAADELELSTWNAMLGAQHPSGRWWTYNTPMDGAREASAHSIVFQARAGTPELNCCSVNGPRGLGMLSEWAVLADAEGPVVNFHGPMRASLKLKDGTALRIEEETAYPEVLGPVAFTLWPERPARFTLKLRIPAWSRETEATLPGQKPAKVAPGLYLRVEREWRDGDRVVLSFDDRLRVWAGDLHQSGKVSLFRGPLLLAFDPRWNVLDEEKLPALDARALSGSRADVGPPAEGDFPPILRVRIPSAGESAGVGGENIVLCDYATAGATGTRPRTWLTALNLPPPPVILDHPPDGGSVPTGRMLFTWGGRRRGKGVERYRLLIARDRGLAETITQFTSRSGRAVLETGIEPGREHFFRVVAENRSGTSESEVRSFRVDPALPPLDPLAFSAADEGPLGLLLKAPLRGDPAPSRGALLDATGVEPAPGPGNEPRGAVAFDGKVGRIRYAVPYFPAEDFTVLVRLLPRAFPAGKLSQVFSAWAGPMDDPLRITIEGGKVFARLESGQSHSTEGAPLVAGEWVDLAAVKSGAKLTLYVNGEERSSAGVPEGVYSECQVVAVGGNPLFTGDEYLAGSLTEFALYARALSAAEIRAAAVR